MSERRDVVSTDAEPNDAATAFAKLTGEVALLRRAIEQLSTEKAEIDGPDYSITLGEMAQRLGAIESKPAMTMTPEDMAARIGKAAEASRRTNAEMIDKARNEHRQAANEIQTLVGTMRSRQEQRLHLQIAIAGGIAAGCLIWSILPGVILRVLPASWHMPESMAAHIIGEPTLWEAGSRMMQAGDPGSWRSTILAVEMRRDNREAIEKCERAAAKAKGMARCTIRIGER